MVLRTMVSDGELVELISRGDSNGFSELYKKHYNMVRYFVEKNSGSPEEAADLFQEVLIILFEKSRNKKFKLKCSMKTFIYSIARNQWLKKLKSKKITERVKYHEEFIAVEQEDIEENQISVTDLLNEIGDACKKILILFYYRRKSNEEICTLLDYANADTVKNQKYKCIQRLKKMVESKN